jgi:type IX secretion system PorP/SprF family membrane protein
MKKYFLVLGASVLCIGAFSQQERQLSHYMYDLISINPASAGSTDKISTHAIMRQQWVGIDGAPEDLVLNLDAPFRLFKADHGIGASIWSDKEGFNKDINLTLSYAYQFQVGNGKLGLGLSGSFMNRKLEGEWEIPDSPLHDPVESDDAIPQGKQNEFIFDLGFGLFYRTDELYVGISSTHLMQDEFVYQSEGTSGTSETKERMVRHYYLTAGYTLQLSNPAFELLPSVMLQSDSKTSKIDLNTTVLYNKKFWAGVSYRVGTAVVGMIGVEIFNGLKVGYSYDFDTTALTNFSSGSHEVMLGYSFNLGVEKIPQKYKSIRFL